MKYAVSIFILFFLQGCVEVGFKNPQPEKGKTLEKIPQEMIAFYTQQGKDSTKQKGELQISDWGEDLDESGAIPENSILKYWKGNYFFNQKKDSLWYIIMIVPGSVKNTFDTYKMDGGNEKTVSILKQITRVNEVYSESGDLKLIIIDPSTSEFKKIIKSGAFEKLDSF